MYSVSFGELGVLSSLLDRVAWRGILILSHAMFVRGEVLREQKHGDIGFDPVVTGDSRMGEECAVVRVPQANFQMSKIMEQRGGETSVPLVDLQCLVVISASCTQVLCVPAR
ncbi:hypothetical protein CQ042_04580 [Microbacterium sp. MYb62]|nr:hypothetical protein CQ042_04580 [Microbacterium sp. MYb62]